jgi:hypothetical protein
VASDGADTPWGWDDPPDSTLLNWILPSKTTVRWDRLGKTVVGSLVVAVTVGWSSIMGAVATAYQMLFGGLAGFGSTLVESSALGLVGAIDAAWSASLSWLSILGPVGGPAAVAIGLVTIYVVMMAYQQGDG